METIDVRNALKLISTTPSGCDLVEGFLRLQKEGKADVFKLGEEAMKKLLPQASGSTQTHVGHPAGGFYFDGKVRQIYLEPHSDFRIQAPLLVHELAHCVDETYIESYSNERALYSRMKETAVNALTRVTSEFSKAPESIRLSEVSPSEQNAILESRQACVRFSDRRLFATERRAYDALHQWVIQLGEKIPAYRTYLAAARAQGYVLDRLISDEEIIRIYGINGANL